jgi:uncharacterized Zn finger protein
MTEFDLAAFTAALRQRWSHEPGDKARKYINQFWDRTWRGQTISGKVVGNHGTYTVSITVQGDQVSSRCSCYIGKHGYCHHCAALAFTFLGDPDSFQHIVVKALTEAKKLNELSDYLAGVTLDDLIKQLRQAGITQKAFAESIGMSTQHLSAVKSSELRHRYFHELGATKLACLWVLEHFAKQH